MTPSHLSGENVAVIRSRPNEGKSALQMGGRNEAKDQNWRRGVTFLAFDT